MKITVMKRVKTGHGMQPKRPCCIVVFGASAFIFLTAGLLLLFLWESLYNLIVSSNLVLQPNSSSYKLWIKNPIPLSLKLYVFNWTNPEEIRNRRSKPRFEQLGSYTYGETKEKSSITWNANNTVTFKHLKKWYFDEDHSEGSLDDLVTSINPVALSAAHSTRTWSYLIKKTVSVAFSSMVDSIAITQPVGKVLFDGYEDRLMNLAKSMPFLAGKSFPPMEKFGWFYGRNGSEDFEGTFNMDTGVSGQLGELYRWKDLNRTSYYPGVCGEFTKASAGEFFPTNLNKSSVIKFFSADLCRYVELEFEKEVVVSGLVGYKYSAGDKFLDNGTKIPENECFCVGDCMPSGALNVSACRYGSPAFVSLPHFNKADPYYLDIIEGLEPDPEKHDFFMIFEPTTGIPLKVAARLQLNLRMDSVDGIRLFDDVPTVFFPVLWFEQIVAVPDDMIFGIKVLVNFKVICLAISIILIVTAVLIEVCMCHKICTADVFSKERSRNVAKEEVPLNRNAAVM